LDATVMESSTWPWHLFPATLNNGTALLGGAGTH
jgi:hypothetical protein